MSLELLLLISMFIAIPLILFLFMWFNKKKINEITRQFFWFTCKQYKPKTVLDMELKEILFYSCVLVFFVGYGSFKYYKKKYESFSNDQSYEQK